MGAGMPQDLPAPEPRCACDPRRGRFCEAAQGLHEDLRRAAVAGAPVPGTTCQLGHDAYELARQRYRQDIQAAFEFRER
jgi:hypothetical protein